MSTLDVRWTCRPGAQRHSLGMAVLFDVVLNHGLVSKSANAQSKSGMSSRAQQKTESIKRLGTQAHRR